MYLIVLSHLRGNGCSWHYPSSIAYFVQEVKQLRHTLFPPLMCAAAANGDIDCLVSLSQQGGDFNIPDYDGRTPLHLACSEGHLEVVKYLLLNGASVHMTDRFNHTPLDDAVRFRYVYNSVCKCVCVCVCVCVCGCGCIHVPQI